jgi:beta-fructofuranosidase
MYTSKDGISWSFVKVLDACKKRFGTMWECPDFFSLEDKQFLVVSPMDMEAEGLEFHSGHGVVIFGGSYDKKSHDFTREWVQACDYGIDFYAPQTLIAPDGRRIMIGWMRNWATTYLRPDDCPIFGAMTLPRELSVKGGRLYINPVRELEVYRTNAVAYENVMIKEPVSLEGIKGRILDMTVRVKADKSQPYSFFKITLAKDETHGATIIYRPKENTITIDRTLAGKRFDTVQTRSFEVDNNGGAIKLRVIMDKDSVEVFVNDGERVATFLVYNELAADDIEFCADEQVSVDVEKYDIEVK